MTLIERYLQRISRAVESIQNASVEFYEEQLLASTRVNLRFKLRWSEDAFAEVSEAIELRDGSLTWLSYRYHFQSAGFTLRYDDAPHHPGLNTYPQHRHQNAEVGEGWRPDLETFLQEIRAHSRLW